MGATLTKLLAGIELGGTQCVCVLGTGPSDLREQERLPTPIASRFAEGFGIPVSYVRARELESGLPAYVVAPGLGSLSRRSARWCWPSAH